MATAIDVQFRADISNLTQQLGTLPGITEKQAKEMVKGLESNIKKAEKAAVSAAKKSEKAWGKTGKQFKAASGTTSELSQSMAQLGDKSGDADSTLKALGGAVGVFSPQAEKAFTAMGDLAGGAQGLWQQIKHNLGPMGLLTAAVGAGMVAWKHYSDKLEEAEQKVKAAAAATQEMIRVTKALKEAQDTAELRLAIALGEEETEMMMGRQAELSAERTFRDRVTDAATAQAKVQMRLNKARSEETDLYKDMGSAHKADAEAYAKKKAEVQKLSTALAHSQAITKKVRKEMEDHASTLFTAAQAEANASKGKDKNTSSTKKQKDAIQELIDTVGQFDPKLSQMEQMAATLAEMQAAVDGDTAAFVRLKPHMEHIQTLMGNLEAEEAAKDLEKLTAEAAKIAKVADPIEDAADVLARLRAEAQKNAQTFVALQPEIQRIAKHVDELRALDDPIELIETDSFSAHIQNVQTLRSEIERMGQAQADFTALHGESSDKIAERQSQLTDQLEQASIEIGEDIRAGFLVGTQAAAMFAQAAAQFASIHTQNVQKEAEEELEIREEASAKLEESLRETQAEISRTEDKAEKARLQAQAMHLETQIAAEAEATESLRETKNKAIEKAFKQQQKLQVAQAIMATAHAVIKAWEVGPIAGPVMSAAAAALGAAQIALIRQQEAPMAHIGGMVGNSDETLIKARTGEGVLTAQGVQAIGGAQGLANANAGLGGAGGQIVIQQVYRHRVLDTVLQDSINKGGPITTAINRRNRRGRRNPFRRAG